MGLVEKLERRAKELDGNLKGGEYNKQKYDDRELLEHAAKRLRFLEQHAMSELVQ